MELRKKLKALCLFCLALRRNKGLVYWRHVNGPCRDGISGGLRLCTHRLSRLAAAVKRGCEPVTCALAEDEGARREPPTPAACCGPAPCRGRAACSRLGSRRACWPSTRS